MLVDKRELKTLIIQETLLTLIKNDHLEEAKKYYLDNHELLDESFIDKFLPPALKRSWKEVVKTHKEEAEMAAAVKELLPKLRGGDMSKSDITKMVNQYIRGDKKTLDWTPDEIKLVAAALGDIKPEEINQVTAIANQVSAGEGEKKSEEKKASPQEKLKDYLKHTKAIQGIQGLDSMEMPYADVMVDLLGYLKDQKISANPELKRALDIFIQKIEKEGLLPQVDLFGDEPSPAPAGKGAPIQRATQEPEPEPEPGPAEPPGDPLRYHRAAPGSPDSKWSRPGASGIGTSRARASARGVKAVDIAARGGAEPGAARRKAGVGMRATGGQVRAAREKAAGGGGGTKDPDAVVAKGNKKSNADLKQAMEGFNKPWTDEEKKRYLRTGEEKSLFQENLEQIIKKETYKQLRSMRRHKKRKNAKK